MQPARTALIGHTGFVGANLAAQFSADEKYRSTDIDQIRGKSFDLVLCAGIQAKKWWANQNPEEDLAGIQRLLDLLETVSARRFVLISTVDVYPAPVGVDEGTQINPQSNHAYGRNRFLAEEFVRAKFAEHLIIRLPGLFGTGIKKNVIHDLLNNHELDKINPVGVYQYYYLERLRADIDRAAELGIQVLNVSAEPVSTQEIMSRFFFNKSVGPESTFKASYDMHSLHWESWDSSSPGYLYSKEAVFSQLSEFIAKYPQLK